MISKLQIPLSSLESPRKEIYRAMGYGEVTPDSDILDIIEGLITELNSFVRPAFIYRTTNCDVEKTGVNIEDIHFETSRTIASLMRKSESGVVFIATAGGAFQRWLDDVSASGDAIKLFIADAIGTTIVEMMGDYMERCLEESLGEKKHTNRFSPGYCGWNIEEQFKLFSLFDSENCGVTLNSSSLMHPIKSISGVIGVGDEVITKKYGCSICKRTDCYMRIN